MPIKGQTKPGDVWYKPPPPPEGMPGELWERIWAKADGAWQEGMLQDMGLNPDEYRIQMDQGGNIVGPDSHVIRPAKQPAPPSPEQQKLADMRMVAQSIQARRPEVEAARMNALRMQSQAMQPLQNAMATLYGGRGPSSALPNGMGPQPQQPLRPPGPDRLAAARPDFTNGGRAGMHNIAHFAPQRPPFGGLPDGAPGTNGGMASAGLTPTNRGPVIPQLPNGQLRTPRIPQPPPLPPSAPTAQPGPPPGTGVSGVTFDPTGMFNSPFSR